MGLSTLRGFFFTWIGRGAEIKTPDGEAEGGDQKNGGKNSPRQTGSAFAFGLWRRLENWRFIQCRGDRLMRASRGKIIGDGLLLVETNAARVSPDESFVEDTAWKTFKLVFL